MKLLNALQFYFGYKEKTFGDALSEAFEENAGAIILVILFAGVITVVCLAVVLGAIKNNQKNVLGSSDIDNYKRICIKVKVVNKVNKTPNYNDPFNHVVFEKEDGERLNFALQDEHKYNDIVVGDEGLLTYAGRAFIDFIRVNP